jgi:predicted deacylase
MSTPFWKDLPAGFHQRRYFIAGDIGFEVFIWRGDDADSRVLLLNGATHGDEWEGPTFLTELATHFRPEKLNGTIVAVPVLNEGAFFACNRVAPSDQKNLARVFPGSENGAPTEKLAHAWQTQFIQHANFYVDIHSAGAPHEIWPWAGYVMHEDAGVLETQRKMASCFPNMWHWGTPYLPGRTISAACENNVPAIYLELQGKGGCEAGDLEIIREGFANIVKTLGFVPGEPKQYAPTGLRESTQGEEGHLQVENPAPCDGILTQIVEAGKRVHEGETLAIVQPLDGGAPREVLAAHAGRAVMVRRFRAVREGDALAVIVDI